MKKSLLIIALGLCSALFFQASATNTSNSEEQSICTSISQDEEYVEITLDQVIPAVKVAIESYLNEYEINLIEFNAQAELTRVSLKSTVMEDQLLVLIFDKEGKVVEK